MFSLVISNNAISSEIVASIKPLHSLVSAVAGDSNSVSLLIEGSMSPHNFALKPSHAKLLNNAKVVFYIDNQLESALKRTVIGLPVSVRVVRASKFKQLNSSIDPESDNPVCNTYSAAYLHHLFNAKEMLGGMLLSLHNIYFYQNLMKEIRASIEEKRFQLFSEEFLSNYN